MSNEALSPVNTELSANNTTSTTVHQSAASTEIKKETAPIAIPSNGGTPLKNNSGTSKKPAIKLPSIADIKSGKFELKKEEKQEEVVLPTNEFSYGDFKHYWDEAIAQIAAKNQASINVMISNLQPELKDNTAIYLQFNNKIQLELFQTEKPFIAGYLREKLQNYDIDFVIEMNSTEQDNTPYTNAEKFKAMTAKNPNLQVLRDVLGLDIS
jgi:DNA polymerase III subunit gamma/tau